MPSSLEVHINTDSIISRPNLLVNMWKDLPERWPVVTDMIDRMTRQFGLQRSVVLNWDDGKKMIENDRKKNNDRR